MSDEREGVWGQGCSLGSNTRRPLWCVTHPLPMASKTSFAAVPPNRSALWNQTTETVLKSLKRTPTKAGHSPRLEWKSLECYNCSDTTDSMTLSAVNTLSLTHSSKSITGIHSAGWMLRDQSVTNDRWGATWQQSAQQRHTHSPYKKYQKIA